MTVLPYSAARKCVCASTLICRYVLAAILISVAAASGVGQTEKVVTVMLPTYAFTTDPDAQAKNYLAVAASGAAGFEKAQSWLYFSAGAIHPIKENDFRNVQLRLVPIEGAARGMTITVASQKASPDGKQPRSYSAVDSRNWSTLVSPPLPTNPKLMKLRSDSVSLTPGSLFGPPYDGNIGLVLLPQPNASRRIYYGLNTKDDPTEGEDHPGRLPRLIITFNRKPPWFSGCTSEPSALALVQSDGRPADTMKWCGGRLNEKLGNARFIVEQVAADTVTTTPVVYANRLYVVRKVDAEYRLEERYWDGGVAASVRLHGEVPRGSLMVADRYGRLSIITNDAIFSAQLQAPSKRSPSSLPTWFARTPFAFNQVPKAVVAGPDGTLYIVQNSIYALNLFVGKLPPPPPALTTAPEKIWEVAIEDPDSARITLSPDGRFLYVLGRFSGKKSRFIAINAQTGEDVQLSPGRVNTSGNTVTWVDGMKFDGTTVGQRVPVGSASCTVKSASSTSLTCQENLGTQLDIPWADFPDNLTTFRNPVVAKGLKGDFIYITGNSGSETTLWGVKNDPVMRDGSLIAHFTGAWTYDTAAAEIGQPILDATIPRGGAGVSHKLLYFVERRTGVAGDYQIGKLIAIQVLNGKKVAETPASAFAQKIPSIEGNPVIDSYGNIVFWSNGFLYGFRENTTRLFVDVLKTSTPPQILVGPQGNLYAVEATTVNWLHLPF